jgi:hypothetical protein
MGSWRPWNAGTGNSWRPARSTAQGLASRYEPAPPTFIESMNGAIPPTERHCCIGGPAAKAWQEEGASVHARRLLHPGGSLGPGRSRLIWAFPRNFGVWLDMVVPRWVYHIAQNRVLDSDAYILHVEVATEMSERSTMHASLTCCIQYISVNSNMLELQERKFAAMGLENWQSRCYVPASSDAMVVAFRRWFRKHSKNQVG